jgi:hypothetical protein
MTCSSRLAGAEPRLRRRRTAKPSVPIFQSAHASSGAWPTAVTGRAASNLHDGASSASESARAKGGKGSPTLSQLMTNRLHHLDIISHLTWSPRRRRRRRLLRNASPDGFHLSSRGKRFHATKIGRTGPYRLVGGRCRDRGVHASSARGRNRPATGQCFNPLNSRTLSRCQKT